MFEALTNMMTQHREDNAILSGPRQKMTEKECILQIKKHWTAKPTKEVRRANSGRYGSLTDSVYNWYRVYHDLILKSKTAERSSPSLRIEGIIEETRGPVLQHFDHYDGVHLDTLESSSCLKTPRDLVPKSLNSFLSLFER